MSFSQLNNNSLHIIGSSPRVFILGNAVFQYPKLEISLKLDYTKTINIVSIYQRYKMEVEYLEGLDEKYRDLFNLSIKKEDVKCI